ncbi:hypothetical protein [Aestuariivirga sp.]|uniref:hypothetical protein n=1 Tax=Aestuariivirga sp. TaxID=2650926 RepID=UPI0035946D83
MILHILKRTFFILLGYGVATIASGVVVGLIFAYSTNSMMNEIFGIVVIAILFIGVYAALPALLTVIAGEVLRLRIRVFYMVAATLIGMALPVVVQLDYWFIAVGLGFGPIAGLIYWASAGRSAGYVPDRISLPV